jgi:competence protein ComEC
MVLEIHFLNVGHGDCTIIDLPSGRLMMLDINNSTSLPDDDVIALAEAEHVSAYDFKQANLIKGAFRSWEDYYRSLLVDPAEYFAEHFSGRSIFRYVQTHPDMDHMSGLHRLFWQDGVSLANFWDTDHVKKITEEECNKSQRYAYVDWLVYEILRAGCGRDGNGKLVPAEHGVIKALRGDSASFWEEDGIEILSPTAELIESCNERGDFNNCSYVLKISYAGRVVILPGDAEGLAWRSILEDPGSDAMKCDILKAAHHGRESGYHKESVEAMSPEVVVCSVGKKPSTDASDEYAAHGASVLSTRYHGTITAKIWYDGDIWITDHNGNRIYTI